MRAVRSRWAQWSTVGPLKSRPGRLGFTSKPPLARALEDELGERILNSFKHARKAGLSSRETSKSRTKQISNLEFQIMLLPNLYYPLLLSFFKPLLQKSVLFKMLLGPVSSHDPSFISRFSRHEH